MRKSIVAALAAFSLVAGAGAAVADKPENPGEKGHCTAFFNGQKNGHEKQKERTGEYPGPFEDLLDRAPDGSDEGDAGGSVADLFDYCNSTYGSIGGNPDENGRFTTCYTNDDDDPATPEDEGADTHNCDD